MKHTFTFIFLTLLFSCNRQENKNIVIRQPIIIKNKPIEKPKVLKFVKIINVSDEFKLAFKEYDTVSWFCDIYVIKKNIPHKIIYGDDPKFNDEQFCGFSETYSLSPNGKFIVVERIERGYVEDGKTKILHENAFCWLINLEDFKFIDQFQSACGGEWNEKNEWVYGDEIKFSPN